MRVPRAIVSTASLLLFSSICFLPMYAQEPGRGFAYTCMGKNCEGLLIGRIVEAVWPYQEDPTITSRGVPTALEVRDLRDGKTIRLDVPFRIAFDKSDVLEPTGMKLLEPVRMEKLPANPNASVAAARICSRRCARRRRRTGSGFAPTTATSPSVVDSKVYLYVC